MEKTFIDPDTTDITRELQIIRELVRSAILIIGKKETKKEAELSDPTRAVIQLKKFELCQKLNQKVQQTLNSIGIDDLPLDFLIHVFEYGGSDAWRGTLSDFIASVRKSVQALQEETKAIFEFDAAVQKRRQAIEEYERLSREVEQLEQEIADAEGEEWKDGFDEFGE